MQLRVLIVANIVLAYDDCSPMRVKNNVTNDI